MTLTEVAIRAANKLRLEISYGPTAEAQSSARVRQSAICERFRIVWLNDHRMFVRASEAVEYGGRWYMASEALTCDYCEDLTPAQHCTPVHTSRRGRSNYVMNCSACLPDTGAWCCSDCTYWFHEDVIQNHQDDEAYCNECYAAKMEYVPSYHGAHRWQPRDCMAPSYSMELELVAEQRDDLVRHLKEINLSQVSWEADGSLPSGKGLEILIQHRPSLDRLWHDSASLVNSISRKGFGIRAWSFKSSEGESGAGIHVNCNRDDRWDVRKLMRLCYMVKVCKYDLVRISGRESSQWASFPNSGKNMLQEWVSGYYGKYLALRIGADRMEWRMFRSVLTGARIKLYLDTIKALEDLALSNVSAIKLKGASRNALQVLISNCGVVSI